MAGCPSLSASSPLLRLRSRRRATRHGLVASLVAIAVLHLSNYSLETHKGGRLGIYTDYGGSQVIGRSESHTEDEILLRRVGIEKPHNPKFKPKEPPPQSPEADAFPDISEELPPLAENTMRLYLCRGGETDWHKEGRIMGQHEEYLNERGSAQAEKLGLYLRNLPLDMIASSPLSRASVTADRVAHWHPNARHKKRWGLMEMDFGDLEGVVLRTNETAKKIYQDTVFAWSKGIMRKWPDGEDPICTEKRICDALLKVGVYNVNIDSKHCCIIGHGRTNKLIMSGLLYQNVTRMADFSPQDNCCVSVIDIHRSANATLVAKGLIAHVKQKLPPKTTRHHRDLIRSTKFRRECEANGGIGGYLDELKLLQSKYAQGLITKDQYIELEKNLDA